MSELLVHATHNEHRVVADLMAPRSYWGREQPPITRLVVDAVTAIGQDEFASAANDNGVPFLVDPLTLPLPHGAHPTSAWLRLPYAREAAHSYQGLRDHGVRIDLVQQVVEFQIDRGATMIIPAYVYANSPNDPWHLLNLALLRDTAQYVSDRHPGLSLLPVFCGQADGFTRAVAWDAGIGRFAAMALSVGADMVAVSLSPVGGQRSDKYDKTLRYFSTLLHVQELGLRAIAWHQGVFGAGLIAAGLHGYSTGIAKLETTKAADDARGRLRAKRERKVDGGSYRGLYLDVLGHSVPFGVGELLVRHERLRPQVMCTDEACCSSWSDMLENPREHAIRARARQRRGLDRQPRASWRLTQVARDADAAVNVARHANQVLEDAGHRFRVKTVPLESLRDVSEHLRRTTFGAATA